MLNELFGVVAEEKERKTFSVHEEARSSHAFQTLNLVS